MHISGWGEENHNDDESPILMAQPKVMQIKVDNQTNKK
jgi:hypothetical protein